MGGHEVIVLKRFGLVCKIFVIGVFVRGHGDKGILGKFFLLKFKAKIKYFTLIVKKDKGAKTIFFSGLGGPEIL